MGYFMKMRSVLLWAALTCIGRLGADTVSFYVTNESGTVGSPGTFISIVDTTTNTVVGYVDTTGFDLTHPLDIHFNSDDTKAYVTADASNAVFVINVGLNKVVGTVNDTLGPFDAPGDIEVNLDTTPNIGYITNEAGGPGNQGSVSIIDLSIDTVTGVINDALGPVNLPIGMGISDDGTVALIANFNGSNVSILDTATNTVTGYVNDAVHPFVQPQFVAWSDSTKAYVSNNNGAGGGFVNVVVAGAVTGTVSTTGFPPFSNPINIVEGPDGAMYISDEGNNNVYVVNPLTDAVTAVFTGTFSGPLGISITPDNTTAYVNNSNNNTVSIVDVATKTQTGLVNVSSFPFFTPYQSQIGFIPTPTPPSQSQPLRPMCIRGKQKTERFVSQSDQYNTITWCASPSQLVSKYNLYRNGVLTQSIGVNDPLIFKEYDVSGTIIYSVTAVNASGEESLPVAVSVP
jgi:YVTN family beta-propeller protein